MSEQRANRRELWIVERDWGNGYVPVGRDWFPTREEAEREQQEDLRFGTRVARYIPADPDPEAPARET